MTKTPVPTPPRARYPRELESGTYDKTRRYEVVEGTRYVQCTVRFHVDSSPRVAADIAVKACFMEATRLWGRLSYDQMQYVTTYLTCAVLVELRIWP